MKLCTVLLGLLAFAWQDTQLSWTGCGITRHAFMQELVKAYEHETGTKVELSGGGATKGIRAVSKGTSQLGGSCRHAVQHKDEKDVTLVPVAWDALVVVTHAENPIESIGADQLAKAFSGTIEDWSELGVPDLGPVRVHARAGKTSGVGFMARLLLFFNQDKEFATTVEHPSSGPLEEAVEKDRAAIAVTGMASARRRPGLKILALNGVKPTAETILDESYDLIRPLYLTIRRDRRGGGPAADFVEFALSEKGQAAIASTGSIPIRSAGARLFPLFFKKLRKAEQEVARHRAGLVVMSNMMEMPIEDLLKAEFEE